MRIVGGAHRGRRLFSVKGRATRPTSDRVRESVFNILAARIKGVHVLDLFAGTGALGVEALSRGADSACFIDNSRQALLAIYKNINMIGLDKKSAVIRWDATNNLNCLIPYQSKFKVVFMDPPYGKKMIRPAMKHLDRANCLEREAILVVEHTPEETLDSHLGPFFQTDQRRYGKTLISFYNYIHNEAD